jgi:ribonuclease-3
LTGCSPESTDLEARLGHKFRNRELLERALTHASANPVLSYERLEFLGDRVLGLVAAQKLYDLYPGDAEGALALKFNALARREACVRAAESAGIAEHLILANAEAGSGGRKKGAILAGTCEAVIAALYLDGGMEAAHRFIDCYWAESFAELNADMRDPKTRLQEWAQSRSSNGSAPAYNLQRREGPDHAPKFFVEVRVRGLDPETGEGNSKREAEQDAASKLLVRLGLK